MTTSIPALHPELPGVTRIDHHWMGVPGAIASYLLADGGELALVEAGPASTVATLLAGIRAAGHDPADVSHLLLTHIHLDHAAAAGLLLRHFPRAVVGVHLLGAPHLADPSRLVASATRLYGARMDELWGTMLPVPAERMRVLRDGDEVRVGGRRLTALDTPGHARHHLAFHLADADAVFTGDVGGVRVGGAGYVRPPTPPPEFDPPAWLRSIGRLRALRPEHLLLTHFGAFPDAGRHLDELEARVATWTRWAAARVSEGADVATLTDGLRRMGDAEIARSGGDAATAALYETAVPYGMMAAGIHRFLTRGERPGAPHGRDASADEPMRDDDMQ